MKHVPTYGIMAEFASAQDLVTAASKRRVVTLSEEDPRRSSGGKPLSTSDLPLRSL